MADVHIYFGIENLAMNESQKSSLHGALQALGIAPDDPSPARRPHWRWRLDREAVIYEALFDDADLTVAQFRQRLADAAGVAAADISATMQPTACGRLYTFTYDPNATDYFRMIAFGFDAGWPSWESSRAAAVSYLQDNQEEWEEPDG